MPETGSFLKQAARLAQGHVELGLLETRFEAEQAGRRAIAIAFAAVAALTGFVLLQIALVQGLIRLGLSLGLSAFILTVVYFAVTAVLVWRGGRRDLRAGEPYQGTREEFERSAEWIQKRFS